MNETKGREVLRKGRRHLRPAEREQIVERWGQSGLSAHEVAEGTGVSRSSLTRWKRRLSTRTGPAEPLLVSLVEVPPPIGGLGVAEVMSRGGAVRLFAVGSPQWAAQLVRELNRC